MQGSSALTIDLSVIRNNVKRLIASCGPVMVMVKAQAYGTSAPLMSKFLQQFGGIPFLGVSHVWEGIVLRKEGITLPVFVISAPPHEVELVCEYGLHPAVSTFEELEALESASAKRGVTTPVHLHLNTGMNRFGAYPQEAFALYTAIQKSSNLLLEGVMTHFIGSEDPALDAITHGQISQFKAFLDTLETLPRWIHAANSAGAVRFPIPFCNLVRVGLGILGYGVCVEGVKPALTFTTRLASISPCTQGENVGYNCTYTFDKAHGQIGVIPVGYHDGLHRAISGKGYVFIHGKKAPMIGRVCMDFIMIDLTDIPEACVGDEVTIFGPSLSPEQVAEWAGTDVREILVNLPPRVQRIFNDLNPLILRGNDDDTTPERLPSSLFPFEKDTPPG